MWEHPYADYVGHWTHVFGGRAGFASHVFPQCVLAAITLVGGVAGDGGARAGARTPAGAGLHLCSAAIISLSGLGSDPKLLEQKP